MKLFKKGLLKTLFISLLISGPLTLCAQSPFSEFENLFSVPKNYVVTYAAKPPVIDGDINDVVWQQAKWSEDFVDIEGDLKPNPPLQTNIKMLWGDSCLYVAAQIHDPQIWATLKNHDDIVYLDNDFELFIDPLKTTHQYFEIEVNPLNTIFDLSLNKPYRNGGNAMTSWDATGLRSAVKIQGTLNDPSDIDKGWTVEMAIPFKAIGFGISTPHPTDGTIWRINFSRVEYDTKVVDGKYAKLKGDNGRNLPEHNWVWSPQGVINMHFPERWGYLQFSKESSNTKLFALPYSEFQKKYLWLIYYQEKKWFAKNHTYEAKLADFNINDTVAINGDKNTLQIEATKHQFMAFIKNEKDNTTWSINQDGLIQQLNPKINE